jgi:hypothetical protein
LITFFPETDSGIGEQKANPHWVDQEANHLPSLFGCFKFQALRNLFGLTSKVLGFNFLVSSFVRLNLSSYSTIPYELTSLDRLKKFSVANNQLSGRIPGSLDRFGKEAFDGNSGLCGGPLGKCGLSKKNLAIIIVAGVSGAAGSLILGFGVWWWYH